MKYGLTRRLHVYSISMQKGEEIIATAGDYLQSQLWCSKHVKDAEDGISDLYQSYAWAWFALKRNGKLDEYGVADELSVDALTDMASDVTVFLESVPDDSLPLAGSRTQPRK